MIFSPAISYKAAEIWDTFPTMLCGVLCLGMLLKYRLERTWSQILAGVVLGLVAMVNPCFSACYAIWVVANWKYWNQNSLFSRRFVLRVIFILIGFLAAITPWSIRNRVVFGEWFYLRSNLGFEMWLGNAPWSDGYFFTHDGKRMHPIFNPDEESRLVQAGEAKYLKDRAAEVWGYFHTDTARVAKLCLKRVKWFWFGRFPKDSSWGTWLLKFIGFTIPGILALAGMAHLLVRRRDGWVLLVTMMVFPIPYYLSIMMVRYRLPMEPLLLLMAAWFISVVYERWSQQQRKSTYSQLLHNQ